MLHTYRKAEIMEFWVVAAAAGAGYVAKHWQNLSGEKDGSSKLSPRVQPDACQAFSKMPNSIFPLPNLAKRCLLNEDVSSEKERNKVGINLQDTTDEINVKCEYVDTSGHRLHEFRTKNSNRKSFSSTRPLVVTSNSNDHHRKQVTQVDDVKDHNIVFMEGNGAPMEAGFFEPIRSLKLPTRLEETHIKRFETRDLHSQGNDMVSLFLGITIGILSTTVTNQHEIEHLNGLLEQAENMVKDLHNKLEIKEGFTTKEHRPKADTTATNSPNAENFGLTSEIEAELEAELEILEENMKDQTLQRLSNVMEIDSDFEADMARGDLNLNALTWQLDSQSESEDGYKIDKSESTGFHAFTPNYVVSPLDLRLRLHEVMESELRARIEELEAVLKNQNTESSPQPQSPEPHEEDNSFWDFDHTRIESSSSTP